MTLRRTGNQIPSIESVSSKTGHLPARSAHQTKAQPSLRPGAGGVGGLVAVSIDGDYYFPGYDNNGNVIGYWDEDGEIVAEYAYDAFGNTIYEDGDMAEVFPHRFSTKYYDAETDLYYYGYRYYSPSLGRWISRDPIGEEGGLNLLSFCKNNSSLHIDPLGNLVMCFSAARDNDDEGDAADRQVYFSEARANIREFAKQINQLVSEEQFNRLKNQHKITFNKEEFTGEKQAYLSQVQRELQSFYLPNNSRDIESFIRVVSVHALFPGKPYDMIGVTIHGEPNETKTRPTGRVMLIGPDAVDFMPRSEFNKQLREQITKALFPGTLVIVSCYQEFKSGNTDVDNIIQMIKTKEKLEVTAPVFVPSLDTITKSKNNAFRCGIHFEPFKISRVIGDAK